MRIGKRALVVTAVAAVLALGAGGVALADIPDSGVINGCYKTSAPAQGALMVIDQSAGQSCPSGTMPLSWNQTGAAGVSGYQLISNTTPVAAVQNSEGNWTVTQVAKCPSGKVPLGGYGTIADASGIPQPIVYQSEAIPGGWEMIWWTGSDTMQESTTAICGYAS